MNALIMIIMVVVQANPIQSSFVSLNTAHKDKTVALTAQAVHPVIADLNSYLSLLELDFDSNAVLESNIWSIKDLKTFD